MKNIKLLTLLSFLVFAVACEKNNTDAPEGNNNNNNNNNDDLATVKADAQTWLTMAYEKVLSTDDANHLKQFVNARAKDAENIEDLYRDLSALVNDSTSKKADIKAKTNELEKALRDAEALESAIESADSQLEKLTEIPKNLTQENAINFAEINQKRAEAKELADVLKTTAENEDAETITAEVKKIEDAINAIPKPIKLDTCEEAKAYADELIVKAQSLKVEITGAIKNEMDTWLAQHITDSIPTLEQIKNDCKDDDSLKDLVTAVKEYSEKFNSFIELTDQNTKLINKSRELIAKAKKFKAEDKSKYVDENKYATKFAELTNLSTSLKAALKDDAKTGNNIDDANQKLENLLEEMASFLTKETADSVTGSGDLTSAVLVQSRKQLKDFIDGNKKDFDEQIKSADEHIETLRNKKLLTADIETKIKKAKENAQAKRQEILDANLDDKNHEDLDKLRQEYQNAINNLTKLF